MGNTSENDRSAKSSHACILLDRTGSMSPIREEAQGQLIFPRTGQKDV